MLRLRLFLGFVPLLLILLAVGGSASWLISRLAGETETVLLKNYHGANAIESARRAVMRMDRDVWFALDGHVEDARANFATNVTAFHKAIDLKRRNSLTTEELRKTREMVFSFEEYRKAGELIMAQTNSVDQQVAYMGKFEPRQTVLSQTANELRAINDRAMEEAERKIQSWRARADWLMMGAGALGLALALAIAWYSARAILRPIQALTRSAVQVGEGQLDQAVPVVSNDELGQLASAFNQMSARLREAQERVADRIARLHNSTEATLSTFPDPIFVLDAEAAVELANPAADELSRRLGADGPWPAKLREHVERARLDGVDFLPTSFRQAVAAPGPNGEHFYLPRVLVMRNPARELIGVALVLLDITRFRLLDDVKNDLVATVSHELKTPLTSILMVLHLLREQTFGALVPQQEEFIAAAIADADRLQRILNDLLDLSRLEHESTGLVTERVAAGDLIEHALAGHHALAAAAGIELCAILDPDLPAVEVDPQRFGHALGNLISNAIKHSPPGDRVIVAARVLEGGEVRFSVADHGPGIAPEHQARIFDKFYRVPNQSRNGAGLGLSIAREIVRAHGGRIGVRSQPGSGSEFFIELNAVPAPVAFEPAE
jgi:NtrC-family two-component system sensor histidine kinase KinB